MKKIFILFFLATLFSCKERTREDLENRLKTTMRDYLYEQVNNDSSRVKYDVQSVIFYPERDYYHCEFNVRVKSATMDTTGTMIADIKGDFKEVRRTR